MDSGAYYSSSGKRAHHDDDDVVERNGRQKKRTSSGNEPNVPVSEETEYRILCPLSKIGGLIGKGGAVIKAIRTECRSKLKVEEPVSGSDERVVSISSSLDQIKEHSNYVCPAQEALFRVHARITELEDDDEPPQPVSVRLLVPKSHIGCLLGKGGKIIEQMRKEIGVHIRILPKEQHPLSAGSTDELVQVTGDGALVRQALYEVSTRLHENITGERVQKGNYMSRVHDSIMRPMFASGSMYSSSGFLPTTGSLVGPPSSLGGPLGYTYGGLYGETGMGSAWTLGSGLSLPQSNPRTDEASEEEFSLRVLCPNSLIGNIIGKRGNVIKKMREETGAKIKIEDPINDCDERVIFISSLEYVDTYPSPGIQGALQVFWRLVEIQMDKDMDNKSFVLRLLVPSSQVGCLLGKGGSIVSEMRKVTKANIRISPKDEPSKCAEEHDESVQIMGDQNVVQDALIQILSRLRANLFKGQESKHVGSGLGSSMLPMSSALYGDANLLSSNRGRLDSGPSRTIYPLTNLGYHGMDYGYGGYGAGLSGAGARPFARDTKESRRG